VSFCVGFLPSGILVTVVVAIQVGVFQIPFSPFEIPLLGCIGSVPLLILLAVMVWLGSKAWGSLDPSAELLSPD